MPTLPHVAIVLLNYNGRDWLERFLPFIVRTTYLNKRVYLIDNASTDDSIPFLAATYPDISLIRLTENMGYAGGYNKGLSGIEARYFILLNTDVEPTEGFIEPLIMLMEVDPVVGICQPKILSLTERNCFEYAGGAGGWIDTLGYTFARGRIFDTCEEDQGQYDGDTEIFWASGACLVIRADLFCSLGGFYEYFFMYSEEVDLCWRAKASGYKIAACSGSVVYHKSTPLFRETPERAYYNFRNNLIMLQRNVPGGRLWLILPVRVLLNGLSFFHFLAIGCPRIAWNIFSAHIGFVRWLFFEKRPGPCRKLALSGLSTSYKGSVVYQYFILQRKKFSQIVRPRGTLS